MDVDSIPSPLNEESPIEAGAPITNTPPKAMGGFLMDVDSIPSPLNEESRAPTPNTPLEAMGGQLEDCASRTSHVEVEVKINVKELRMNIARMIIMDGLPYGFVEGKGFRSLCNVMFPGFVTPSHLTVARDCIKLYQNEKMNVKKMLYKTNQRVCLSANTLTSAQDLNYVCLTVHFIDNDWNLHNSILNFCQVPNLKGDTVGSLVKSCLLKWGIDRIFTVTVDDAKSNDGVIDYLKRRTKDWEGTIFEFIHMRCYTHIVSLIVNEALKEFDESIVKVRNVVRYVKSSPTRFEKFKACVEKENISSKSLLCLDVPTRWDSTYLMLKAAENFQRAFECLKEDDGQYLHYFLEEGRKILEPPVYEDWDNVRVLIKLLEIFYDVTLSLSSSLQVTSNAYFYELCSIQIQLNKMCASGDPLLVRMAGGMKRKYVKYWGKIDRINLMVFVAVVLDPRYKLKYVKFCLKEWYDMEEVEDLVERVRNALNHLYEHFNKMVGGSSGQPSDEHQSFSFEANENWQDRRKMRMKQFKQYLAEEDASDCKSEVDQYLTDSCENLDIVDFDILNWWKVNSSKYPILAQVARDVLAIPVSIDTSESAFSTGGHVLDNFQSSLFPKSMEAMICAQSWLRSSPIPINVCDAMDEIQESY